MYAIQARILVVGWIMWVSHVRLSRIWTRKLCAVLKCVVGATRVLSKLPSWLGEAAQALQNSGRKKSAVGSSAEPGPGDGPFMRQVRPKLLASCCSDVLVRHLHLHLALASVACRPLQAPHTPTPTTANPSSLSIHHFVAHIVRLLTASLVCAWGQGLRAG